MAHLTSGLLAYIDPTGGLPPSMWGIVLAGIVGAVGAVLAFLRSSVWAVCRWIGRRAEWVAMAALVVTCGLLVAWYVERHPGQSAAGRRVLVLGIDGLDPRLLEQYLRENRLPHFARLAADGVYHSLGTTTPPQSPVAWSSFWTASGPEQHGVYDFFKRDPATYRLDLAISDRKTMRTPWLGEPFWEVGEPKIRAVLQRAPLTFPPKRLNGQLLAGMGVWDARGTQGTYFFYREKLVKDEDARGMQFEFKKEGDVLKAELPGLLVQGAGDSQREPFELMVGPGEATLRLQGKSYKLLPGRWSDWIRVEFSQGLLSLTKASLLTRALWQQRGSEATLYVAPLNFDPAAPIYPITYPKGYAAELAEAIGPYFTRGMPFDTQALDDGVLGEEPFLEQCKMVSDESERMMLYEIKRQQEGLLFSYYEEADTIQHVFWRGIDSEHPLGKASAAYGRVIPDCYERFDALVGRARAAAGKDTVLVVLSDHGFGPFRTSIHLNAILRDHGYLKLLAGAKSSKEGFENVDWSQTQAYAAGFNTIYLNLAGREGKGIVPKEDAARLSAEIATMLENFVDPVTKERPILKVHIVPETAPKGSPDLILGYLRGYRTSFETALGKVPETTTSKNERKWSGDHLIDASEVPGVFLSSDRAIDAENLPAVGPQIVKYLQGK
jgi:predicted AlkP superfamily phosphohydrolase/phosphomutase